jgi:3-oxoacyl-[acyl-carrier protein] reductase
MATSGSSEARHALVTGSSSGIGAACARRLLSDGWRVTGLDLAAPSISELRFEALQLDLRDPSAVQAALEQTGPVQALVHAAGVLRTGRIDELDPQDGQQMWQLHVDAATRLAQQLLPAMAAAGHGRVVLIGSRVSRGIAGRSQYAATKAALVALARSWAAEVVSRGVTVNVVSPAATATGMLQDPARQSTRPKLPPLGRLIEPEEVAASVAFLLGAEAAAITGQELVICGGASLEGA